MSLRCALRCPIKFVSCAIFCGALLLPASAKREEDFRLLHLPCEARPVEPIALAMIFAPQYLSPVPRANTRTPSRVRAKWILLGFLSLEYAAA